MWLPVSELYRPKCDSEARHSGYRDEKMADPVTAAASVVGLVSLAMELSKITHWYLSNVAGAPESWAALVKEAEALRDLLVDLDTEISDAEVEKSVEHRASVIPQRPRRPASGTGSSPKPLDASAAPAQSLLEQCTTFLSRLVKKL